MMQSLKVTGDGYMTSPKSPSAKQLKKARKLWKKYDLDAAATPSPKTLQSWYNKKKAPQDGFVL